MNRAEAFEGLRPLPSAIAHRISGSASEAEYAVEATWLRWEDAPTWPASVEGHLAAEVTRICTDGVRSASPGRQPHGGLWPAEPMPGPDPDPERPVELADSLVTAFLLVFERLSWLERAVFVLREVFGCRMDEIAAAVGCSEEACRQLVDAIALVGDGGRESLPWPTYMVGAGNVARLVTAIVPSLVRIGITLKQQQVHGRPGLLFLDRDGRLLNTVVLDLHEGRIQGLHLAVDCEEFAYAEAVAEASAVLRETNRAG
ncbi:RNA polymerase subunit sigma-24 (plasmid) [Streptomyces xanthophaeus]|uniref:sigma factor-like helix-turn-helix DNA-binding protein n=1 Tax=Streptomyces xanthophaeus TaxID=67385 RepID=UPI002F91BC9A|nr:RNA polymerase subunit sigma-24 [Streptomyces xanthophaeus]WST65943.1 RNA polymerase subunit sigma-24 [Streptomyces xanthophaeus]